MCGKEMLKNSVSAAVIGVALCAQSVMAQEDGSRESASIMRMDEIVVTADKLSEKSVLDSPFSISAVSGESLETLGVSTIEQALAANPGVSTLQLSGSSNLIQIRGVSSLIGDATVGFYLDDLPLTLVNFQTLPELNPYDLSRMEVLRGPQGTLYGASSQGGTIRILTNDPVHNEFFGKATAGVSGTKDGGTNWLLQGAVNIPLIEDKLSIRAVGSVKREDGFIDLPLAGEEDYNSVDQETFRGKLRFTPTENLDVKLSYWGSRNSSGFNNADADYNFSPAYVVFDFTNTPVGALPVPGEDLRTEADFDLANFNFTYDFGDFSLYSTTSYIDYTADLSQNYIGVFSKNISGTEVINQEARVSYDAGGSLKGTVGFFYADVETTQLFDSGVFIDGLADPVVAPVIDSTDNSKQWALFGELSYEIVDGLTVLGGLRYFEDKRSSSEAVASTVGLLEMVNISADREAKFDKLTFRANVSYEIDENALIYVNVAQGFRSASGQTALALATSALSGVAAPLFSQPEDLISAEVGGKFSFLENKVTFQVAAYYLDWKDIITQISVISPLTMTPVSFVDNVGAADGYGVDLALVVQPTDNLVISLSANFNDTEYKEDLASAGILAGDQVGFTPDHTLSATVDYRRPLFGDVEGAFLLSYQRISERFDYSIGVTPAMTVSSDAIDLLGLRLGLVSENWSIYATGENLINDDGSLTTFAGFVPLGIPPVRSRPRTFGVEVNVNF